MPRYKTTAEALKIISNKEQIRNFGVIAHVDHGKCVDGDSLVTLTSGEIVPIREVYSQQGERGEKLALKDMVMLDSMNPRTMCMEDRRASFVWHLKSDRLVEVRLADGKAVKVTPEHPFYSISPSGFLIPKKAEDIRLGDKIAVAEVLKSVGSELDELKMMLLNLIAADEKIIVHLGTSSFHMKKLHELMESGRHSWLDVYSRLEYLSKGREKFLLPKTEEEFQKFFYSAGFLCDTLLSLKKSSRRLKNFGLPKPALLRVNFETHKSSYVSELLSFETSLPLLVETIFECDSSGQDREPDLPKLFQKSKRQLLAHFLRGIFDSRGVVDLRRRRVVLKLSSESLADKVMLMLMRYGVQSTKSVKHKANHNLIITQGIAKFQHEIGFTLNRKNGSLSKLVSQLRKDGDRNIPVDGREVRTVRIALGLDESFYAYEEEKENVPTPTFTQLIQDFRKQLTERRGLERKLIVLKKVAEFVSDVPADDKNLLGSFLRDGLVREHAQKLKITSFGADVLKVWEALVYGDEKTITSIANILDQWESLCNSEVRFVEVVDVKKMTGNFSVYDLTVPETHTYVANGIIVHNTTTSDSLLAACGMLSPSVAGQALALDYMPLEQQRQMTIKAANVTLYYEHEGKPYVFNMIDTPGHIDFTGKVTRSLRAIDGAVVVVDSVEGVMTQTETVTRQALEERVRPVLYINKIDRLVKELRLTPDRMQSWLANIIGEFNNLINLYAEPELRDKWKVSIQDNSVAFGSSKDKWGFNLDMAKKNGISFKDVYEAYTIGDPKVLAERSPLHEAILTMVIRHHPPPHVAQSYRIPKIWRGDLQSDIGKALLSCDENGPIVMMVTNVIVDPQAGIVATGRLFSGTIRDGDVVYLVDAKREGRVQSVNMYMGNVREIVGALPAGNIPALLGLEHARSGETISSVKGVVPFESIKYVSEPVVTVAIEAKNPRDLPKLVDALQRMHIEDPNLIVRINEESGETLLSGMGVLHLEIQTTLLQQQGIDIITSPPLINYRETIQGKAGPVMAKSPNKHNKIYVRVEPLGEDVISKIRSGEISETVDRKGIAKVLRDMGWDSDEARSVVAVDPKGNMLLDQTKGVQFMQESMDSLRAGFEDVMNNGPLAYEYCRGVKVIIHHFVPHEDPAHRTYAQLMPAARRAILGAMLMAQPVLLEPVQGIEVKCPIDQIGAVASVLSSKRGKLINIEQKEVLAIIEGEIPASETFDLSEVMRGATAGKAVWDMHFKAWAPLPASLQKTVITQIRKRKGLPEEVPPATDFIDTE